MVTAATDRRDPQRGDEGPGASASSSQDASGPHISTHRTYAILRWVTPRFDFRRKARNPPFWGVIAMVPGLYGSDIAEKFAGRGSRRDAEMMVLDVDAEHGARIYAAGRATDEDIAEGQVLTRIQPNAVDLELRQELAHLRRMVLDHPDAETREAARADVLRLTGEKV